MNNIKTYTWPSLSDKGIWYSKPRPSLEHSVHTWLFSHFYCHTTTIPYRYVCSSCNGWFSVLQLSCWIWSETRLCSSRIIFNLLLVAIALVSHRDLQSSDFVGIEYRLDGGLFNLRQAKNKTSSAMIFALQYADYAAFLCLIADGHQRILDVMSEAFLRAGLIINTTKTESLSTSSPDAPTFFINGNQHKN